MASKKNQRNGKDREEKGSGISYFELHPDIKRSVIIVVCIGLAMIFILAGAGQAGPFGATLYSAFHQLFGWGYYLLPAVCFLFAFSFLAPDRKKFFGAPLIGGILFVLAGLGFFDVIAPGSGGFTGNIVGALKKPFGTPASLVITFTALVASFLVTVNRPVSFGFVTRVFKKRAGPHIQEPPEPPAAPKMGPEGAETEESEEPALKKGDTKKGEGEPIETFGDNLPKAAKQKQVKNYVAPPLSLLSSTTEKPTIGDLRANANIIKRTLESFGISVEMGEINVGPTVTRYTLKPAEGMKLSRITALNSDLALALAAHPIRIEAPIPGKSLVGIEVPNKAAAIVRLGSLLLYPEFHNAEPLSFALGRNVNGEPIFADIAKMPHLLIAGATGSGKSIAIHSMIISLLFRNSPEMLRFILVDPKRVELSIYGKLPHLIAPVVTENKKAIGALRWLIQEMDRRYQLLLDAGCRDIKSYNKSAIQTGGETLPYLVLVIDELADLMSTYGREVEGSIIRLAQMARATGIHLIVSTQRPSVEVITGLIKANITSRVALQVASQIDSRTILDTAGAEKLLGHGDLLFVSSEMSKPRRIQGGYLTEDEIKKVVHFIAKNNQPAEESGVALEAVEGENGSSGALFDSISGENDDDELYGEAVEVVRSAQKASASLLQRRLKVGYARAARLLDIMEERGVVGPGEGAKPRDILL